MYDFACDVSQFMFWLSHEFYFFVVGSFMIGLNHL
jgi:hypothetical protein